MVGHISLEEQVDKDFSVARRKVFFRRMMARRNPAGGRLLCFDETRKLPGGAGRVHRGIKTVRVERITGSVDRAFHRGKELPPVNLYKIGDDYFVLDGNHRVSVSRYHGVEMIDAEVTEFRAHSPRNAGQEMEER